MRPDRGDRSSPSAPVRRLPSPVHSNAQELSTLSRSLCALIVACAFSLVPAVMADSAAAGIWTEIPSGTTQSITAIEYQSPTRFWFTTTAGAIYTRQPDGSFLMTRAPSGAALNDIEFQAGGPIGLAVGNGG